MTKALPSSQIIQVSPSIEVYPISDTSWDAALHRTLHNAVRTQSWVFSSFELRKVHNDAASRSQGYLRLLMVC